ncbi:MAG: RNA 2',3'-cyclic phosphodiesterase [Phycisphaerales bacterium]|nr:RNA 2',3'-cyclic phosphodiesterase [Phycisphaerales bacterium]
MRLFLAIELTPELKRSLTRIVEALRPVGRTVRWVGTEQMHLTLKFLGELPDSALADVCGACEGVAAAAAACELVLDRAGYFGPANRVRVIWGGSSQTPAALSETARRCDDAFEALGVAAEQRPFAAHITLGRVKLDDSRGKLSSAVDAIKVIPARQPVTEMTLFESRLGPRGPQYTVVGRYGFRG